MEKNAINNTLVILVILLVGAVAFLAGGKFSPVEKVVYQNNTVYVDKPVAMADNSTNAKLDVLLEDKNFETVAYNLAVSDLESKDYKDLYNALVAANYSIKEKSDISSVTIKDSDVTNADAKEGNADVSLELKVYFEDKSGDKVKVYVTVNTEIVDSDVEDVEYVFA